MGRCNSTGRRIFRDASTFDMAAARRSSSTIRSTLAQGRLEFDWDGSGENSHTIVNENGILNLDVLWLESGVPNDTFSGTLEMNSGEVHVEVNDDYWRILGHLNMNNTVGAPVLHSQDTLALGGTVHVGGSGPSLIRVPDPGNRLVFLAGSMTTLDQDLQLNNWRTVVEAGGTFTGPGRLVNLPGWRLDLQDGADTGDVHVLNDGILEVVFAGGLGQATVGGFEQTTTGVFHVDLTSPAFGNYDQLTVMGHASLAGELNAATGGGYGDPTVPGTVDAFVLIVADSLSGAFDDVRYNTRLLTARTTHVGDGLFRIVDYDFSSSSADMRLLNYKALEGDANGDGNVDGTDFNIWNAHRFTCGTDWTTGDFNGDGCSDGADFGIWNINKFTSVPLASVGEATVPEPTSAGLALLMACLVVLRVRQK